MAERMLVQERPQAKAVHNLGFQLENDMSDGSGNSGQGNAFLGIVLIGLMIVVVVLGVLMFGGHGMGHEHWHWDFWRH
jgi:hypothetical protein